MTEPIPSAGETTIIGMPAITIPVTATATSDRPLTAEDLDTIARLSNDTALLISTRGAVSGSRYLLDEDEVTVNRQRIEHAQLKNGDELMIGKFRLVFFTKSAVVA